MNKQFFIIMARPGGGKSTQATLLQEKMEQTSEEVLYVTTGGAFRRFIQGDSFIASRAKELQDNGGLLPEFLAVWNWAGIFIEKIRENTTVILDGAPRKLTEASAMHGLFPFLGYDKPHVIYIEVTRAWSKNRMFYREEHAEEKRQDEDSEEEIEKRIDLFEQEILPCVDLFKNDPRYSFSRINGEQSIEDVHKDILEAIASKGNSI